MPANAIDLCTSAQLAADLGVADDATSQRCVTAASRAIATYCGRKFEKQTGIVEYPASYRRPWLLVDRCPIIAITSVYEGDALVDPSLYESIGRAAEAGMIFRKVGNWMHTGRDVGDITPAIGFVEGQTGSRGVKVTYDAGWQTPGQGGTVTLPEELQEAALLTATSLYKSRGRDQAVAAEALGDWSVTYAGTNSAIGRGGGGGVIPDLVLPQLAPYVLIRVI